MSISDLTSNLAREADTPPLLCKFDSDHGTRWVNPDAGGFTGYAFFFKLVNSFTDPLPTHFTFTFSLS